LNEYKNWKDITLILKERILSGQLKPGQEFPTNHQLMREFNVYVSTIQNAVNALIREGLIISSGSGNKRRFVRPALQRSVRRGGFLTEFGSHARLDILDLKLTRNTGRIPFTVTEIMKPPILIYKTLQWRDDVPVALSTSYIPGTLPVKELKDLLADPSMDLYLVMKQIGLHPVTCEESLIAVPPDKEESDLLNLPLQGSTPVVRITRKVFDIEDNLLELCFLSDRGDSYEFVYRFPLE